MWGPDAAAQYASTFEYASSAKLARCSSGHAGDRQKTMLSFSASSSGAISEYLRPGIDGALGSLEGERRAQCTMRWYRVWKGAALPQRGGARVDAIKEAA